MHVVYNCLLPVCLPLRRCLLLRPYRLFKWTVASRAAPSAQPGLLKQPGWLIILVVFSVLWGLEFPHR